MASMADEARAPDPRTPLPPPDPKRGDLRVSGAPEKPPMLPFGWRRFVAILLLLLVINWASVALFAPGEKRVRVPYSPFFLQQVRAGNVKEISSRGDTIQGDFKHSVTYKGHKAKHFNSQFPTFANDRQLSGLLERSGVVVNAHPPQ